MSAPAGGADVAKLSPSDLTFLWEECQRCFWLKARGVLRRPSAPFPKIFTRLDQQTKDFYFGKSTSEISPDLPPGRVAFGDRWVRSGVINVPDLDTPVAIVGRIDTALAFDEGSFGIIDFKTSEPKPEHVLFYGRQLHAYALATERPAVGALKLSPVTKLGLLCIEPVAMIGAADRVAYAGQAHFLEIERDDDAFLAFLAQVLFVLSRPEPPDASPNCSYCRYLAAGSLVLLTGMYQP